jgi:periplasmic nitrate reductase NapD
MNEAPSRRDVLTGTVRPDRSASVDNDHISSAVVSVLPARRDEVMARLAALPGAEVHHSNASKLVVVLEGPGSGALGGMLADISGWPGVLSANMVFEQRLEQET